MSANDRTMADSDKVMHALSDVVRHVGTVDGEGRLVGWWFEDPCGERVRLALWPARLAPCGKGAA